MVLPIVASRRHDLRRSPVNFSMVRGKKPIRSILLVCVCFFALVFNIIQMRSTVVKNEFSNRKDTRLSIDESREMNVERAIFYNIFVPTESDKRGYALDLVQEQLQYFSAASDFVRKSSIFYNLIGDTSATEDVELICNKATKNDSNKTCKLLKAAKQGDEGLTLEAVFDYCNEHPFAQVTYLHNKGSFHPTPENTAMRRMLTKSVFADECQAMPLTECSVCAGRFTPLPYTHFSGNVWTADCNYVKELIRPSQFSAKMDDMMNYALALNDGAVFPMPHETRYLDRPYDYATKRFAFEYWVGSHPTLKPCDVYAESEFSYGYKFHNNTSIAGMNSNWKPVLQKVPWIPLERFWQWSFNEWFCGRGRLAQYKYLYDAYPEADSFVWKYYEAPMKPRFRYLIHSLFDNGCPTPIRKSDYL